MTTQSTIHNASITAARGSFLDTIIEWFGGLSPISDDLDMTITMNANELRANLDHGRMD